MVSASCPVCGSPAGYFLKNKETGRDFFRCGSCGYIFADSDEKRLTAEEERSFFKSQWGKNPEGGNAGFHPSVLSLARTCGLSPMNALDFGCGDGGLVRLLRSNGIDACGVDRVEVANDMQPHVFSGLESLPPGKFDMITAIEVFEHLPDPIKTLEALLNLLTKEGFLLLTTALTNRSMAHLKYFPYWIYQKDPTHIGFFAEKTFEMLAKRFGVELQIFGYGNILLDKTGIRLVVFHEGNYLFYLQREWDAIT